jgi:hypothetical protein
MIVAIRDIRTGTIQILGNVCEAAKKIGMKNGMFIARRIGRVVGGYEYLNVEGCFLDGAGI